MGAGKLFGALLILGIALFLIYLNMDVTATETSSIDSEETGIDCKANFDGHCSMEQRLNCNGFCDTERSDEFMRDY